MRAALFEISKEKAALLAVKWVQAEVGGDGLDMGCIFIRGRAGKLILSITFCFVLENSAP